MPQRTMTFRRAAIAALCAASTLALLAVSEVPAGATYPGANGKIAFTVDRTNLLRIWTMNGTGTSKTEIAATPRDNFNPHWNGIGDHFYFIATTPRGVDQIYSISKTGNLRTQITTGDKNWSGPVINPAGTKIIASGSVPGGHVNLFRMNADGTNQHRFTKLKADDVNPMISPDGTKVVWERIRNNGHSDIMRKDLSGSGLIQLTGGNGEEIDPCWTPDGLKIVYTHIVGNKGTGRVWKMNNDGTARSKITNNGTGTFFRNPIVSPDGLKIAYIRDPDNMSNVPDVYTMNFDGTNKERLTDHNFQVLDMDWGKA